MALSRRQFLVALAAVNAVAVSRGLPVIAAPPADAPMWQYDLETPWDLSTAVPSWKPGPVPPPRNLLFNQDGTQLWLY